MDKRNNSNINNYIIIDDYNDNEVHVTNVVIYDLQSSLIASGYPKKISNEFNHENIIDKDIKRGVVLGNVSTGTGHDNFLKGVRVSFDINFSNKAWVEAERYSFFDIVSSQSTMHCISKMDINNSCNQYVDSVIINRINIFKEQYLNNPTADNYLLLLYNIPSGFKLTARISTNYCQLKTIYHQRKNHKLPEWRLFCEWIEQLPLFKEICLSNNKK